MSHSKRFYRHFFKRTIDIGCSLTGLLVLAVPMAVIALWLKVANHGAGVFFRQRRPGRNGRIFMLVKFKTMSDRRDSNGYLLPDAQRLTRVGKFIRSTSLDELPQLWNVLKGDMSLIGPRPLLPQYLPLYDSFQARRHEVRPGITGWAQVNGRNAISWQRKFECDVWYVDNISLATDFKIFLLTIKKVFVRDGISSGTCATMEAFTGNASCGCHPADNTGIISPTDTEHITS